MAFPSTHRSDNREPVTELSGSRKFSNRKIAGKFRVGLPATLLLIRKAM
jgi:hypothetical protein